MNKFSRMKSVFLVFLCLFVFSIANADSTPSQPKQSEAFKIISESYAGADIYAVMPSTSKALSKETSDALISISADGQIYRFSNEALQLQTINIGDVLVSEGTLLAPDGFMRRVTAVWNEADQLVFQTEQAFLTDVFHEASVSISQQVVPSMISEISVAEGVTLLGTDGEVFSYMFDKVLFDQDMDEATVDDQIKLVGQVNLDFAYDFDFEITPFPPSLDELTFLVDVTETASLSVESGDITFLDDNFEVEIVRKKLNPIVIGIVPVVPEITLSIGLDGTVQANVSASVSQQFDFTGGMVFDGSDWETPSDYSNTFNYSLPDLSNSTFEFKGYTEAKVTFLIGGLPLGPSLSLKPYLILKVNPTADPWWELIGGLEINGGVVFEISSITVVDRDFVLVNYDKVLARSWATSIYIPVVEK